MNAEGHRPINSVPPLGVLAVTLAAMDRRRRNGAGKSICAARTFAGASRLSRRGRVVEGTCPEPTPRPQRSCQLLSPSEPSQRSLSAVATPQPYPSVPRRAAPSCGIGALS